MLDGSLTIVTGGSRGIGREISLRFAEAGSNLVINYNKSKTEAYQVADEIKQHGVSALPFTANVTNEEMEAVIEQNPDIHPMRMALANRYFDEVNYSEALPHFMYIAENSAENELKSFALAQIGWMVFESNNFIG